MRSVDTSRHHQLVDWFAGEGLQSLLALYNLSCLPLTEEQLSAAKSLSEDFARAVEEVVDEPDAGE